MYIGTLLPDHGLVNPDFFLRGVVGDSPYLEDPGEVLPLVGTAEYR